MSLSQSATSQLGWGFHTLRGGINPGDLRFRPRVVGVVDIWKGFESGDETHPPRVWRDSGVGPRGTLAARWLHEPQPISNHPAGLGFPHPAGRYRPGESAFTSPGSWSCRDMDGFLIRGWEIKLPGVRWLSTIPCQSPIGQ